MSSSNLKESSAFKRYKKFSPLKSKDRTSKHFDNPDTTVMLEYGKYIKEKKIQFTSSSEIKPLLRYIVTDVVHCRGITKIQRSG